MDNEQETPKSAAAFHEYCLLGYDRSLAKLALKLGRTSAYTRHLESWSAKYNWQERAREYDAHWIEEQDKVIAQERAVVIRTGFALQHKRILSLDRIVTKLIEMTEDEDKVWLPDVKAIGNGPNAERVDLVNFNAPLFALIDKYKASIAAEMGERVKKTELTGKDGGPIKIAPVVDYSKLTDEELVEIERLAQKAIDGNS
jgi:hypothetical protein